MIQMFMRQEQKVDLSPRQHAGDIRFLEAALHIGFVPPAIEQEFVPRPIQKFNLHKACAAGGIVGVPGFVPLTGRRPTAAVDIGQHPCAVVPANFRDTGDGDGTAFSQTVFVRR